MMLIDRCLQMIMSVLLNIEKSSIQKCTKIVVAKSTQNKEEENMYYVICLLLLNVNWKKKNS